MVRLEPKEKALAKNISITQEEEYEIAEQIIFDFKEMGIKEFEYLRTLSNIVLDKKRECKIIDPEGYLTSQKFIREECEIEAIDLLAGDNFYFANKYSNLVTNKDYVDDNLYDYNMDDDISYKLK